MEYSMVPSAKSVMMAFRLELSSGEIIESSDDDNEAGGGQCILKEMRRLNMTNCVVFVPRWLCDSRDHIFDLRWEIIADTTADVAALLNYEIPPRTSPATPYNRNAPHHGWNRGHGSSHIRGQWRHSGHSRGQWRGGSRGGNQTQRQYRPRGGYNIADQSGQQQQAGSQAQHGTHIPPLLPVQQKLLDISKTPAQNIQPPSTQQDQASVLPNWHQNMAAMGPHTNHLYPMLWHIPQPHPQVTSYYQQMYH